jgi:hypothetical protein
VTDDARVWGAIIGLLVVLGNKAIDSAFKAIDRLIDHALDEMEAKDDEPHP